MKRIWVTILAAGLLSGCGTPSPDPTTVPSRAAPSNSNTSQPDCGSNEIRDRAAALPVTCVLISPSFPTLRFEFSDTAPMKGFEERKQTIVVRDGERVVQTIIERIVAGYRTPPFVQRFEGDGFGQLLVVTTTGGSGGSGKAVWRAQGPQGPFVRGGELFGFPGRVATTDEGFSAIYAHSSAVSGVYTVFRFDGDRVVELLDVPVAAASVDAQPSDGEGPIIRNGGTNCRAVRPEPQQAAALRAAGVAAADPGAQFCRQGWIGSTYR